MQSRPSLGTSGTNAEEEDELVQPGWFLLFSCREAMQAALLLAVTDGSVWIHV